MYPTLFGGVATDLGQTLSEKPAQWCRIWKCDDAKARLKACQVIRRAMATGLQARDFGEGSNDLFSGA